VSWATRVRFRLARRSSRQGYINARIVRAHSPPITPPIMAPVCEWCDPPEVWPEWLLVVVAGGVVGAVTDDGIGGVGVPVDDSDVDVEVGADETSELEEVENWEAVLNDDISDAVLSDDSSEAVLSDASMELKMSNGVEVGVSVRGEDSVVLEVTPRIPKEFDWSCRGMSCRGPARTGTISCKRRSAMSTK